MLLDLIRPYFVCFISLYIAINITGKISMFLTLTEKLSFKQKRRLIRHSIIATLILMLGFIYIGKYLMLLIGIVASDFKFAGGLLLLFLAINLLIFKKYDFMEERRFAHMGIIPLATPLIATPALFIISMISFDRFGIVITLTMLVLNLGIAWLVLKKFKIVAKLLGERGISSLSKILNILLAAFAIMAIRQGLVELII
ncbi:MarC family protein, partial [Candidatus Omnitrophota bacterium]